MESYFPNVAGRCLVASAYHLYGCQWVVEYLQKRSSHSHIVIYMQHQQYTLDTKLGVQAG